MSRDRLAGSVLRVVAGLLLAWVVLLPVLRPAEQVPAADDGVTVTDHRAAYVVDGRGTLRAAETLTVSLARPTAGLERRFDLRDPGSVRGVRAPREVTVTRDGQAEEVALRREAGVVVARLGDHDRELTGEHVYVLRWTVPGVLATAGDDDDRARLRLDLLPAGWGLPVLRSRTSLELPDRPLRVRCSVGGAACRPRVADRGLVVATGRLAVGEAVRVDAVLDGEAPGLARLPWPLRLVPALGERRWPPVVVLLLTLATSYAGTRLAAHPRPRRTRLLVVGAVLATGVTWLLAPWTLVLLVPGAFVVAALPLLLPDGAARAARERVGPV
ncbi:hypothetical protein ASG49_04235 [Marmoricola sp. Leaf446]|uniref:DUF2207 domain-containing protein n=1 Tax=Marmoricola sp. Leaf446 TaxID=1736379 RepID=UPI0006FE75EA|nr:DUF2207 domain-containing protein [Marmoricola sp. Leaf446]KQT94126.1 hypothetical protein ASG49_04235 [Marmoricola sp. Leaf446]